MAPEVRERRADLARVNSDHSASVKRAYEREHWRAGRSAGYFHRSPLAGALAEWTAWRSIAENPATVRPLVQRRRTHRHIINEATRVLRDASA